MLVLLIVLAWSIHVSGVRQCAGTLKGGRDCGASVASDGALYDGSHNFTHNIVKGDMWPRVPASKYKVGDRVIYYSSSMNRYYKSEVTSVDAGGNYNVNLEGGLGDVRISPSAEGLLQPLYADGAQISYYDATAKSFPGTVESFDNSKGTYNLRFGNPYNNIISNVDPVKVHLLAQSETPLAQPPIAQVATVSVPMASTVAMTVEDFNLNQNVFDPNEPQLKAQLLPKLDLPPSASVKKLGNGAGSLNEGIWILSDYLVLKLVPHNPVNATLTEREKFIKLQKYWPDIAADPSLAFPSKIFKLIYPSRQLKDLIVMRKAAGKDLVEHLHIKFPLRTFEAFPIFYAFGKFLRGIHDKYGGMQHGDCHPSNVFFDQSSNMFTLVDVADLGFGPYLEPQCGNDVERFVSKLWTLQQHYGYVVCKTCEQLFRSGHG